jgi:hypothetical protein
MSADCSAEVNSRVSGHSVDTSGTYCEGMGRSSHIEENLALYIGVVSNKIYVFRTKFVAVVDHEPLLLLYNKPSRTKQTQYQIGSV